MYFKKRRIWKMFNLWKKKKDEHATIETNTVELTDEQAAAFFKADK